LVFTSGHILGRTLEDVLDADVSVTHQAVPSVRAKASKTPEAAVTEERDKANKQDHDKE
jgi:hypothetical protein